MNPIQRGGMIVNKQPGIQKLIQFPIQVSKLICVTEKMQKHAMIIIPMKQNIEKILMK